MVGGYDSAEELEDVPDRVEKLDTTLRSATGGLMKGLVG